MFEAQKKVLLTHKATDQVDCLKQLKAGGATPWQMTMFGLLNFAIPKMWKSLMLAVAAGIAYGVWR